MKVFISWSGERSRLVAELLNNWIQCVLQAVDPWLSSKDIDKGSLWFSEITNQLSNTHNGIVCLTKANLNNAWILFESGALAKGLSSNRVYTFLIDLSPKDIKDPLAQFNHTTPTKDGLYQLIRTINNSLDSLSLKENILSNVFETYFPQFEKEFQKIITHTKDDEVVIEARPQDDILSEILYSVRGLDKRIRSIEETDFGKKLENFQTRIFEKYSLSNPLMLPISELDFSVRTFNTLKVLRINTLGELLNLDLDNTKQISPKVKEEINMILDDLKK